MDDPTIKMRGRSISLHAPEGVYSYFHPERLFTGLGWDAQTASAFFLDRSPKSILLLGFGGGTVARQLRSIFPSAFIVGVERSKRVLDLATRYFQISELDMPIVHVPGQEYLRSTRHRFDVIIDDMWPISAYGPKPIFTEVNWCALCRSRLRRNGLYAVNLYCRRSSKHEVNAAVAKLATEFRFVREARPRFGGTTVIAAGDEVLSARQAFRRLEGKRPTLAKEFAHVQFSNVRPQGRNRTHVAEIR